jgi:hypothetical protein
VAGHAARTVFCDPARSPLVVLLGDAALELQVLLEPFFALAKPFLAIAGDRLRVCLALFLEALLCLAKALATLARGAKARGQLVSSGFAVELVLVGVDLGRFLQDLLGDLLVAAVRLVGRRGGDGVGQQR